MKTIAFFNNKGGVGKTTLVYHLSWMFAELGHNVVAADLDPQSNLTSMFLDEARLEDLWPKGPHPRTIQGAIDPVLRGTGDIQKPAVVEITKKIDLVPGDLGLSAFEDKLSDAWPRCHSRDEAAFRITSAFYRALQFAASVRAADLVLIDVGPNLGAINRSALIASEHVVIPLASDLFSLQGLRNLGPQLRKWRAEWGEMKTKNPNPDLLLPSGDMLPAGYIVMQHATRADRPVKAYDRWMKRIPEEYGESVLGPHENTADPSAHCLATLKHYRSLMPLAMEARKPMFSLKPADGAIGAHTYAVQDCYQDFKELAKRIAAASSTPNS